MEVGNPIQGLSSLLLLVDIPKSTGRGTKCRGSFDLAFCGDHRQINTTLHGRPCNIPSHVHDLSLATSGGSQSSLRLQRSQHAKQGDTGYKESSRRSVLPPSLPSAKPHQWTLEGVGMDWVANPIWFVGKEKARQAAARFRMKRPVVPADVGTRTRILETSRASTVEGLL